MFALLMSSLLVLAAVPLAGAALELHRLLRTLPRDNADFGLGE